MLKIVYKRQKLEPEIVLSLSLTHNFLYIFLFLISCLSKCQNSMERFSCKYRSQNPTIGHAHIRSSCFEVISMSIYMCMLFFFSSKLGYNFCFNVLLLHKVTERTAFNTQLNRYIILIHIIHIIRLIHITSLLDYYARVEVQVPGTYTSNILPADAINIYN